MSQRSVRKAVIPVAGLGTRFLPATKATPKEMLPVVDKPAIQYVVEEAVAAGLDDVLMITGRSKRSLEDHLDHALELEPTGEAYRFGHQTLHEYLAAVALAGDLVAGGEAACHGVEERRIPMADIAAV